MERLLQLLVSLGKVKNYTSDAIQYTQEVSP